jgi:hypothetical protein
METELNQAVNKSLIELHRSASLLPGESATEKVAARM